MEHSKDLCEFRGGRGLLEHMFLFCLYFQEGYNLYKIRWQNIFRVKRQNQLGGWMGKHRSLGRNGKHSDLL